MHFQAHMGPFLGIRAHLCIQTVIQSLMLHPQESNHKIIWVPFTDFASLIHRISPPHLLVGFIVSLKTRQDN